MAKSKKLKFDYSKIKESKLCYMLRPLGKFIIRLMFKIEYCGQENIPTEGGYILAANHIHAIDPLIIAMGIDKRQMHYMGKKELFTNRFIAWCLTTAGGFPIARGSADKAAIDYAVRIPSEGYVLGIFPEGTRNKEPNAAPGKGKRGVAQIAAHSQCPVLPVAVINTDSLKKHTKYTVRYGKPISVEELKLSKEASKEEQIEATDYIMSKITELWEEGHCSK